MTLLSVQNLSITMGTARIVDQISFDLGAGEILGIVGETGCGKSITARAIMGLNDPEHSIIARQVLFEGADLITLSGNKRRRWQRRNATMIFQHPRSALNPIRSVGQQIADVIAQHKALNTRAMRNAVIDALHNVQLRNADQRIAAYPHELSGGECQRVAIAAALVNNPRLLIADEPTTGLDVVTQVSIMQLLTDLARRQKMAVMLITHDLALAARYCDRLAVMHAGQIAEIGPVKVILHHPRHPYAQRLVKSAPALAKTLQDLSPIPSTPPRLDRRDLPLCRFAERCAHRSKACDTQGPNPPYQTKGHRIWCRNPQ